MENEITTTGAPIQKEWVRVKEAQDFCGMSRTALYGLMDAGLIRNTSLRRKGQIKGTRLISLDSLKRFLDGLATGGEQTNQTTATI